MPEEVARCVPRVLSSASAGPATVAELVDAQDLGSCGATRGGSSPSGRIAVPQKRDVVRFPLVCRPADKPNAAGHGIPITHPVLDMAPFLKAPPPACCS